VPQNKAFVKVFENIDTNNSVKQQKQAQLKEQKQRLQQLIQASKDKITAANVTED